MASTQHVMLSPAELAFLHTSLSQQPPIRPDGRTPTQFRPLRAETGMLPGANGSARICFSDGTEAIVGVKAQVEKSRSGHGEDVYDDDESEGSEGSEEGDAKTSDQDGEGNAAWIEVTVEIPGTRDDDPNTVFLGALLGEALLADGTLAQVLRINRRFHWRLFLDVLLISPPLSYPLPLLSLTTHLALLATRLPRLVSEGDEDPFFDDDWDASTFLYSKGTSSAPGKVQGRPAVTLLVMTVGDNILFDPTAEELAVANAVLAVSVGQIPASTTSPTPSLRLLALRTIDPPSRLTAPGAPYNPEAANKNKPGPATPGTPAPDTASGALPAATEVTAEASRLPETEGVYGVWRAPRGGAKVALLAAMTHKVLEKGGVAEEVFAGLDSVEIF